MAFSNFKPTIWSKTILTELDKFTVFGDICNTTFQGEAKMGEQVKIIGASRPTIKTYTPGSDIDSAETPADTSTFLKIDQFKYYHVAVDDVDQAQSSADIMRVLTSGGAQALAEDKDTFLATLIAGGANKETKSTAVTTAALAKTAIDDSFVKLWNAGVPLGSSTYIIVTPWFYNLFKDKLTELYTNNVDLLKRGIVGQYNGAMVKLSNNVYNDGTYDNLCVCSKDAVAFAGGLNNVEAYRPQKQFSDAIKALYTYGGKIVRPKEIVTLQVKKS